MTPEILIQRLTTTKEFLDRATSALTEEDSAFKPDDDAFTVAQQMAHIGMVIDWFIEGGFGEGFTLNEEGTIPGHQEALQEVTSLESARALCTKNFDSAIKTIASKTPEDLFEMMADNAVMGVAPRMAIIDALEDHTAHHRGSLSVYTRMLGKVPPMPYMDVPVEA